MTRPFRLAALALASRARARRLRPRARPAPRAPHDLHDREQPASSPRPASVVGTSDELAGHLPRRRQGPRPVPLGRRPRLQERLQRRLRARLAAADHDRHAEGER